MMINYNEIFNDSYERVSGDLNAFFDVFYQNFMAKSDSIKAMFVGIDMDHQKEVLVDSLTFMISFSATKQASGYLAKMAEKHQTELKIPNQLYDFWMEALLETLPNFDRRYNQDVALAWRIVLSPGIEFMKHYSGQND